MHKTAMEMAKWAMEKAKACGYDNLSAEDWKELNNCTEAAKNAVCAEKDYLIVEAMKEEEETNKAMQKMGYPMHRDNHGRFIRNYMHPKTYDEDEYMMEYLGNPEQFKHDMRMGYPIYHSYGYVDGMNGNMNTSQGYRHDDRQNSEYGKTYEQYREARRHFTESQNPQDKIKMKAHEKEAFDRIKEMLMSMWSGLDVNEKQKNRDDWINYIQQLPVQ